MGWFFPYGALRADVIDEVTRERVGDGRVFRTLRKCFRGNTMYALHESGPEGDTKKWISVYLLQRDSASGDWGYKPIEESMGPVQMDCPVSYLDEADEPPNEYAREWRAAVRDLAAKRASKKPKKGETWTLKGCRIPQVKITSVQPLQGVHNYTTYTIKRRLLGEKVPSP